MIKIKKTNRCSLMGRITEGDLSSKWVKLGSLNRAVAEAVLQKPTKLNSGLNRPLFKPEIQTTSDHGLVATQAIFLLKYMAIVDRFSNWYSFRVGDPKGYPLHPPSVRNLKIFLLHILTSNFSKRAIFKFKMIFIPFQFFSKKSYFEAVFHCKWIKIYN